MTGLIDGAMSVAEAAELLHVTEKQVQHLGRQGALTYLARGLVDAGSVRALHVARQGQHTRSWSSRTAWAAVALLSQRDAQWLGQAQASRLRSRLRDIDSPRLVSATRSRAEVTRFAGHEAVARRLDREAGTWARRALPQLVAPGHAGHTDWYVDARRMDHLVERYGLLPDIRGQYTFRLVETDNDVTYDRVADLVQSDVLTALDAASGGDPRERGVATRLLDDALAAFRRDG
jgi:hypothetical protein